MKYSPLVSMSTPNSLLPWLEEQLEQRGIDAVYTRYILSLLLDDYKEPAECDHVRTSQYPYQEFGKHGRAKPMNYKAYEEPCSCTTHISKKAYVMEVLKGVAEPYKACGTEEFIEKICQKISELKKLKDFYYTPNKDSSGESSASDCSPPPSPQEESKKYLEAFPSLSEKHIDWQPIGNNPTWVKSDISEAEQFKMLSMNDPKYEQHSFILPKIISQTIKFDTKSKPFINPLMLQQSTKGKINPQKNLLPTIEILNSSLAMNNNGPQTILPAPEMTEAKQQQSNNVVPQESSSQDIEKFQNKFNNHIASIWGNDHYSNPNGNGHIWKYEPAQETAQNASLSEPPFYNSDIQLSDLEYFKKRGCESHSDPFLSTYEKTYNQQPSKANFSVGIDKIQPPLGFTPISQTNEANDVIKQAFYKTMSKDEDISSIWSTAGINQSSTPSNNLYGSFNNDSNNEPGINFPTSFMNLSENDKGMNLPENLGTSPFSRPNSCPIPKMGIPFSKQSTCHSAPNSYRETINESFGESLSKQDGFYPNSYFEQYTSANMKGDKFFKVFGEKSVEEENNLDMEAFKGEYLCSTKPFEAFQKQGMCKKPCTYYMEGECFKTDCKFSHDLSSITCKFWENKSCFKGELCPFLHGYIRQKVVKTSQAIKPKFTIDSELDFPSLSTLSIKPKLLEAETKLISKKKKGKSFGNVP